MKSLHDHAYSFLISVLREARMSAGVTQTDLAERLGNDQSFVSKYERCERRLDYIELRSICLALELDPLSFLRDFEKRLKLEGES